MPALFPRSEDEPKKIHKQQRRVRRSSERSNDSANRKVSFNKDVRIKKIASYDSGLDQHHHHSRHHDDYDPMIPQQDHHHQYTMFGHEELHPSQKSTHPPRVKRNLVRNIVEKFNEEAKRREKLRKAAPTTEYDDDEPDNSNDPFCAVRPNSPLYFGQHDSSVANNGEPFSYTRSSNSSPFFKKSLSEYDLKSPDEVIYAQVVVNGHSKNGVANKRTVHTRVANKASMANNSNYNSMNRNQSVSMSNLPSSRTTGNNGYVRYHHVRTDDHYDHNNDQPENDPHRTMTSRKFTNSDDHHRSNVELGSTSASLRRSRNRSASPELLTSKSNYKEMNGGEMKKSSTLNRHKEKRETSKEKHQHHREKHRSSSEEKHNIIKEEKHRQKSSGKSSSTTLIPREPSPDYKDSMKVRRHLDFEPLPDYNRSESTSEQRRIAKQISHETSKQREHQNLANGYVDTERNTYSSKYLVNGNPNGNHQEVAGISNGTKSKHAFEKNEYHKEEKVTKTRRRIGSKSPTRDEEQPKAAVTAGRSSRNKERSHHSKKSEIGHSSSTSTHRQDSSSSQNRINEGSLKNNKDQLDKKFYYFGANDDLKKNKTSKITGAVSSNKTNSASSAAALSSTKLVKEANAQVTGQSSMFEQRSRSTDSESQLHHQDSGYSSRVASSNAASRGTPIGERIINIEVEGGGGTQIHHHRHQQQHKSSTFTEDLMDERMETSESDDVPNWPNGSQESQRWSSLDEDDEEIVAAHVNTPQSLVREMGKKEISYENSQSSSTQHEKSANSTGLWFEKSNVDSDYRKGMSSTRNDHLNNNSFGNSATLSRLETNKNRINNDVTMRSATVDRRTKNANTSATDATSNNVRILLNGRDITDGGDTPDGRTRQYTSEEESQHSGKSKSSKKSNSSSPSKKVNFKTKKHGSSISPVHREVLLRSSSPNRPPSTTGSLNSTESDASHHSVILHATAVADIPPPRYRYRHHGEVSTNGRRSRESSPNVTTSNKTVTRSFSLLSPFKPKKYKNKYEQKYDNSTTSLNGKVKEESGNSSSEKLDSLSPLPSDGKGNHSGEKQVKSSRKAKSTSVSRHNSMPKDSRFSGFFSKKKNKEV